MVLEKFTRIKRKIVVNSAVPITFFILTWFVLNIRYYYNVSTNMSENVHGNPPGEHKIIMKQPLDDKIDSCHRDTEP